MELILGLKELIETAGTKGDNVQKLSIEHSRTSLRGGEQNLECPRVSLGSKGALDALGRKLRD